MIGVYPLLPNGTCRFLAFDFDNHEKDAEKNDFANNGETWMEEVEAMRTERNRSSCGTFAFGKRRPCMDFFRQSSFRIDSQKIRECFIRKRSGNSKPEIVSIL